MNDKMDFVKILNIDLNNERRDDFLAAFCEGFLVPVNVDMLMKMQNDKIFWNVCQSAEYRVCDSQILMYSSRFLNTSIVEKISGSDFFPEFCQYHRSNPQIKIFLLGAKDGVAETVRRRLNEKIGREIIVHAHSPSFGFEKDEIECEKIVELINNSSATVLAVGVGAPKQELWISKYRRELTNVKMFMAIGATIDFEAGNVKRAPEWMSRSGLEWLYRLMSEPRRLWKRYLIDDMPFIILLLKQKFGLYANPHKDLRK